MPENMYRIISFDRQMGVGVSGSWQASISAVAKCNGPNAPYCVPNELISTEIGRILRLPIPPCGIIKAPNTATPFWFASLDFNLTGNALPPLDPLACFTDLPDLSTGLLLFDSLILNCDRHRGNLAMDKSIRPVQMNIFDHSHALFGFEPGAGSRRLTDLKNRLGISGGPHTMGNRHCLLDVISADDHFDKWLSRIESIPDFFIEETCRDAEKLGITSIETEDVINFLKFRKQNLRAIILAHQTEFTSIRTWRLIL
jgi:hypothetical protein